MLGFILNVAVSITLVQAQPGNAACAVLTPAQVSSLVGAAKALPMTNAANGATCMFQNNDRIVTVLLATVTTADAAKGLFDAKKRIVAGADQAGWGTPAYAGSMSDTAIVGVLKQMTLTEVKVIDKTQKPAELLAKLQTVMKEVAGRK